MGTLVKTRPNGTGATFPSFFDDFLTRDFFNSPNKEFFGEDHPAVNIKETAENFELEVAAPGLQKKDFSVELDNDKLIISANKSMKKEESDESNNYTRREFSYTSFKRTFAISEQSVKSDEISAKYNNGVLYLKLPKADRIKAKPSRTIEIK